MPTITLDKKDVLKLIGKKISDEVLKDRISMLGTDLQKLDANEILVEVFPNRPDMLSEEGFARALSSFLEIKTGLKIYEIKNANYKAKIDVKVKKVRPYAVAAVIKDINLDDPTVKSLMELQEKLHLTHGRNRKKVSIGVYDLDTIKFPLTYTTKPKSFKFTPLEMDTELSLQKILQKHPKGREFASLLEGFDESPIWLDSKKQVLSMPPIINSEETKIKPETKNLFIDATGLDKLAVEQALNILVCACADRGGKIYSVKVGNEIYPNLKPRKLKLNLSYVNKLLGLNLIKTEIKKLLEKMGFGFENSTVLVPAYRTDILHEIDIVEDIAIAYGYENFKTALPNIATIAAEDKFEAFKNKIAEILVGLGLIETSTYHLTNKENLTKNMNCKINCVELENALSKEYNVLRSWMIPSLMQVLKANKKNEYSQKIFEIGTIFKTSGEEAIRLAVLSCHRDANYTEIRQILDSLLSSLNLKYKIVEVEHSSFIPGRVGRVVIGRKKVAYIGEISPAVLENFTLEMPVVAFELNLSELFEIMKT